MPTIINTPLGTIKTRSPLDKVEKWYINRRVNRPNFTLNDYGEIEVYLMRRDHIIIGDC